MKTFTIQAAQGDLLLTKIDMLPEGVSVEAPKSGQFIVAHSETGHHHVIDAKRGEAEVKMYRLPEEIYEAFIVVDGGNATLEHERSFDTHEPLSIEPGVYRISRQREYTAEGFRRAAD